MCLVVACTHAAVDGGYDDGEDASGDSILIAVLSRTLENINVPSVVSVLYSRLGKAYTDLHGRWVVPCCVVGG